MERGPDAQRNATELLARALSDYLAISKGADRYAADRAYLVAEAEAWRRLQEAVSLTRRPPS